MKKIFISYSHEDTDFMNMLEKQLKVLELEGICNLWVDKQIQTGTDWLPAIQTAIEQADIAVLMVSAGFLISPFIRGTEIPNILKRRKEEGLTVLPLFVKPCPWEQVDWLKGIQGFPLHKKCLMELKKPEQLRVLTQFTERIFAQIKSSHVEPEPEKETVMGNWPGNAKGTTRCVVLTPLPPRKIQLIGRESDLAALAEKLKKTDRVVLVNGMGGIGKTEVCKSFFHSHYEHYDYAAWIDWVSSLQESLVRALGNEKSTFIQAAETDTAAERFEKIIARLHQVRESFLLVVDNIEDAGDLNLDALAALPKTVKVLVNSRSVIDGYELQCLDYLSPDECKALFYQFYTGQKDDETAAKIVELSGFHTLTVELLAKTAHHAAMSIAAFYGVLKAKGFNLNEEPGPGGEKIPTTWHNEKEKRRFFDHLLKVFDISGVTKKELKVLVNLSVLPAVYISMAWVRDWLKLKDNNAVVSLVEKGWLKRDDSQKEPLLYLHPVVQEVVKYRARPDAGKCKELILSLARKLKVEPGENPLLKKDYMMYGESVVRALAMEGEEKDAGLATLANNLSTVHQAMGKLDRALEFQLKANDIYEAVLDKNHPSLATSYNNVSLIYQDMGQLDRALEFQLKTIGIKEIAYDKNHPSLATSYNNVSTIYRDMGQLDRALEFQLKAVAIDEATLDDHHPLRATSYNNVSMIYQDMGQLDRALEFQLKALSIREAVLDKNHPDLAQSYNNVSLIYQDMGQLDRALEFQLKANDIYEAVLDDHHPLRATSYNNVSTIYKAMGQLDRALEFQLKTIGIKEIAYDKNHPSLATSYNNVSTIYKAMGQLDRALEFQLKDIEISEKILDKNHPDLATSYNNVSSIYYTMGQLDRALEFQLKAVAILQTIFPNCHPNLDTAKENLESLKIRMLND